MPRAPNVLLINPWITDFAAYDMWLKPTGLLLIGAVLRGSGAAVKLIDCLDRSHPSQAAFSRSHPDGTGKFLKSPIEKPDAIGFVQRVFGRYGITAEAFDEEVRRAPSPDLVLVTSSMTYWYPGVAEAIRRVRLIWPGVPVVLGGRYATLCADHARSVCGADAVFEGVIDSRLERLIFGMTGFRVEFPEEFASLPAPAHDLMPGRDSAVIGLSRGCPFRCTYCVSHRLAPRFEQRPANRVMEEIDFLAGQLGTKHIAFCDDALLVNHEKLLAPVLEKVTERKYKVKFHTPNAIHAGLIDEKVAGLMFSAGFSRIIIGFESANAEFQSATGGKVTSEQFERAVRCLRAAGFGPGRIGAYILMGHPDQSEDDVRESIRAAAALGVEPIPAEYSPIPGSEDYRASEAAFRRNPEIDPLLHNSSLIAYQHPHIDAEGFRRLKAESRALKEELRRLS